MITLKNAAFALAVLFSGLHPFTWAQNAPSPAATPPPAADKPADTPNELAEKKPIDVEESVQRARAIIDGIDSNYADVPSRESIDELEQLVTDVQAADPAHPWLAYLLGRAYAFAGRNGDAIDQLRKFVQTREGRNEWKAYRMLGDLFVGEFPRLAQGSYEKAYELNPNEPSILTGLSNCANRAGNLDEGIRLARLAVDADGYKNVRFPHRLARALIGKQRFDEAEQEAMKALAIAEERVQKNPGKRVALQILVEQYGLLIELVSARILASPTVDPNLYIRLTELNGTRADLAYRLSKHDQVALLEAAITRSAPDSPVILKEKFAAALAEAGRIDDAIAEYKKIVEADPQNKPAADALARLEAGKPETQKEP